ncbi:MAG: hypothetical protein WC306_00480 [Candidatus Paceibacterota bacterium]|jgi:hypothetical protein
MKKSKKMKKSRNCKCVSKLVGKVIPCNYPDHKRCSYKVYNNGKRIGLCSSFVKEVGFDTAQKEMKTLKEWAK